MGINELGTIAGIAAVTTVITEIIKRLVDISGRGTQAAAVIIAIGLATGARLSGVGADGPWFETVLNGVLAGAAAIGIYEGTAYKGDSK